MAACDHGMTWVEREIVPHRLLWSLKMRQKRHQPVSVSQDSDYGPSDLNLISHIQKEGLQLGFPKHRLLGEQREKRGAV